MFAWFLLSFVGATGSLVYPLLDGHEMPQFGLGVYRIEPGKSTYDAVTTALEVGYRMFDTAQFYENEADVGRAILDASLERSKVYVMSKVRPDNHGFKRAYRSAKASVRKTGLGYLDCMVIHAPSGGKLVETYDALLKLKADGLIRSVGVSNFGTKHIDALVAHDRPYPVVNQFELHPMILHKRQALVEYCQHHGILVQAYGSVFSGQEDKLAGEKLEEVVAAHPGKTSAQVLLRWAIQKGFQIIPKSTKRARMMENANVFDFSLSQSEMASLDELRGDLHEYWNPIDDSAVDLGRTDRIDVEL
jgi:diketogulonate reductase-like aldo/keto reductase